MTAHTITQVIERGMCIGCGACAFASGGAIPVTLGPTRMYSADISGASEEVIRRASRVCPFSDDAPSEDDLGVPHPGVGQSGFPDTSPDAPPDARRDLTPHPLLGAHTRTFAGRVADAGYLAGSSSGGLTSWLAAQLIDHGLVDEVICVGPGASGPRVPELRAYRVTDATGLGGARKSHYYAATLSGVLQAVMETDRRYALIGVPCFIKAARALCAADPALAERLVYFIGLVCGHYKTQAFGESLAWQLGIAPQELGDVDFRVKEPDRPANDYSFAARKSGSQDWVRAPTRTLVGGNWGHSAFQPMACDFCDDVVGETADVSFGDAWLPQFMGEPMGTNVVISRNPVIDALFDAGVASGSIVTIPLTAADVVQSQAGGFRHRREGLAVRLADDLSRGLSVPRKRVVPDAHAVSPRRAKLLARRRDMARLSHVAYAQAVAAGDLDIYLRAMRRAAARYARADGSPWERMMRRGRRVARGVLRRLGRP